MQSLLQRHILVKQLAPRRIAENDRNIFHEFPAGWVAQARWLYAIPIDEERFELEHL